MGSETRTRVPARPIRSHPREPHDQVPFDSRPENRQAGASPGGRDTLGELPDSVEIVGNRLGKEERRQFFRIGVTDRTGFYREGVSYRFTPNPYASKAIQIANPANPRTASNGQLNSDSPDTPGYQGISDSAL